MELRGTIDPALPVLVVALPEEAAGLDDRLPVLVTGPGKVRAAAAVSALLAVQRPASVINIGTAGGLRDGLDGVHEIGTVLQHDFDDEGVFGMLGVHYGGPLELGPGPVLATGDRFVAGGALRDRLAERADLCDMEGYAVALAAREAGVPVRLVKLVSDAADEHAGATWQQTLADHARTLAAWVEQHLAP
jgi:adenosylhomocysteine nucleosidase